LPLRLRGNVETRDNSMNHIVSKLIEPETLIVQRFFLTARRVSSDIMYSTNN